MAGGDRRSSEHSAAGRVPGTIAWACRGASNDRDRLGGCGRRSGCVDDGSSTKAGGGAKPVTLRLGTADTPGTPAADQIEEFVRRVDELSDGQLRVEPVWKAAGAKSRPTWINRSPGWWSAATLIWAWSPPQAWDTEGVSTLRALHAPFLVATDELLDRVVIDEVADEMLTGLNELEITGLTLVPEGLRHVFSFGDPLLSPDDFVGSTIRAPTSDTTYALFEALGATPDDLSGSSARPGEPYATGVADGSVAEPNRRSHKREPAGVRPDGRQRCAFPQGQRFRRQF